MMELNAVEISQTAMKTFGWFLTFIDKINRCFPALFIPFRFSEHHSAAPSQSFTICSHRYLFNGIAPTACLFYFVVFVAVSRPRYFVDSCASIIMLAAHISRIRPDWWMWTVLVPRPCSDRGWCRQSWLSIVWILWWSYFTILRLLKFVQYYLSNLCAQSVHDT
jgi:hypothetical protein